MEVKTPEQRIAEFKEAAMPLIKYLCENHHPHVTAIVTGTSIELTEGIMSIPGIIDFLVD
jgi:predicted ATP-binding protein involved in virulence